MRVDSRIQGSSEGPLKTAERASLTSSAAQLRPPDGRDGLRLHADPFTSHSAIGPKRAELLAQAGVISLGELARRQAGPLSENLTQLNRTLRLTREIYTPATVQRWIEEAQTLVAKTIPATADAFSAFPAPQAETAELTEAASSSDPLKLAAWVHHDNPQIRTAVARNPHTPSALLEGLGQDPFPQIRMALAQHPQSSPQVLHLLAGDRDQQVRELLVRRPVLPAAALLRLAQDSSGAIRLRLATRPDLPPDVLATLACDAHSGVRRTVVKHSQLSAELLLQLAHDPETHIQLAVLSHPHTDQALLNRLLAHASPAIRAGVAAHSQISAFQLAQLPATTAVRCAWLWPVIPRQRKASWRA